MVSRRRFRRRSYRKRFPRRRSYRRRSIRRNRRRNSMLLIKRSNLAYVDIYQYSGGGVWSWALNQVPSYSEIENMFDQYKLCMVKLHVAYSAQPQAQTGTLANPPGNIEFYWAKDYTDVTTPTNVNTLMQMQGVQQRTLDASRPFNISIKPRFASQVYVSAVGTGYSPRRGWLQCSDNSVPHYGIKYWVSPALSGVGTDLVGRLTIRATYYIAGRQVK